MRSPWVPLGRLVTGRWGARVVVLAFVLLSGAVLAAPLGGGADGGVTSGLGSQVESVRAAALKAGLPGSKVNPAIVVYSRDGADLTAADRAAIAADRAELDPGGGWHRAAAGAGAGRPRGARARAAAVLTDGHRGHRHGQGDPRRDRHRPAPRPACGGHRRPGHLDRHLLGVRRRRHQAAAHHRRHRGAAAAADLPQPRAVDHPAGRRRAPPTRSAPAHLCPGRALDQPLDGSEARGIASVLVFGAGTDYALLLIARYREELRRTRTARRRWRRAAPVLRRPASAAAPSRSDCCACCAAVRRRPGQARHRLDRARRHRRRAVLRPDRRCPPRSDPVRPAGCSGRSSPLRRPPTGPTAARGPDRRRRRPRARVPCGRHGGGRWSSARPRHVRARLGLSAHRAVPSEVGRSPASRSSGRHYPAAPSHPAEILAARRPRPAGVVAAATVPSTGWPTRARPGARRTAAGCARRGADGPAGLRRGS